jgi:hypothetical protein
LSESELLLLHIELLNGVWSVLQSWIGATTALVAAAYFASSRLSASIVTAMLSLYSLFTATCAMQITRSWGRIIAIARDLIDLQKNGTQLSQSSLILTENIESRLVAIFAAPTVSIVFLASAIYVIYCFRKREV